MEIKIKSPKYGTHTVILDDADAELIGPTGMYLHKHGQFLYPRLKPSKIELHRAIMKPPMGKGLVVDHINRNPLDNRRSNLRIVTIQENLRNQLKPGSKTGHSGVREYNHGDKKYTADIKVNYKYYYLGVFKTIEEALNARKEAELKYWK